MDWVPTMGGGAKLPTLIDFQNEIKSLIERKYATPINRFFIKCYFFRLITIFYYIINIR